MSSVGYTPEQRAAAFWSRVDKTETCWIWTGYTHPSGYGQVGGNTWKAFAHRFAYELAVGPIPDGLTLDHLCRVTNCVNPAHLEPVTLAENIRRAAAAQTHCKHGHDLSDAYVVQRSNGLVQRACRQCHASRAQRRREAAAAMRGRLRRPPAPAPTHCPRGHEYTADNLRRSGRGRRCAQCHRDWERARRQRNAAEAAAAFGVDA